VGPPKYRSGVGNAFVVPTPKGKFRPHLLVMGDGQHLWMANVAQKTKYEQQRNYSLAKRSVSHKQKKKSIGSTA
jgi:hypothetical protein